MIVMILCFGKCGVVRCGGDYDGRMLMLMIMVMVMVMVNGHGPTMVVTLLHDDTRGVVGDGLRCF